MVTVRSEPTTDGDHSFVVSTAARQCCYCKELIVWMRTHLKGRRLCFDAQPVPRRLDDGLGWVPGEFKIAGRMCTVLAPLTLFEKDKRDRVRTVLQLHRCRGRAGTP